VASNGALYAALHLHQQQQQQHPGAPSSPPDATAPRPASAAAAARLAATAGTKRGSSSSFLGVCRPSSRLTHPKPWMAQLSAGHLGSAWWCFFGTEGEAAAAYDRVALAVRGAGCATNFGESNYSRVSRTGNKHLGALFGVLRYLGA
jgi:hypothetical protein